MMEREKMVREELWVVGKEVILKSPQLYIDVDIEADGIAGHGSMLSLGAVTPTGESFYSEIRPITLRYLPGHRQFCEEHGLSRKRLLSEAPIFSEVMEDFNKWLALQGERPLVFTAFNAAFDWSFVDLYYLYSGLPNPFGIAPLDLKSLAIPFTTDWNFLETKKGRLPKIVVPEGDFTHHALEDAFYQQKIHFGLAGLLANQSWIKEG
jgi:hypothetical protein